MKKFIFILLLLVVFSLVYAQTETKVDSKLLEALTQVLQKLIQQKATPTISTPSVTEISTPDHSITEIKTLVPPEIQKGAGPILTSPQMQEALKPILPDKITSDDFIVQLNNLEIKTVYTNVPDTKAVFIVTSGPNWRCSLFESEESTMAIPCISELRTQLPTKNFAVRITDQTLLYLRNRQKANLNDFRVGDIINVYGFMDKDNYGVEALIVRNMSRSEPYKEISWRGTLQKQSDLNKAYIWGEYYLVQSFVCPAVVGAPCPPAEEYLVKPANNSVKQSLDSLVGQDVKIFGKLYQVTETKTGQESFKLIVVERVENLSRSIIPPIQPPICAQVITPAKDPKTGECKEFPTPCDVPQGWVRVDRCG